MTTKLRVLFLALALSSGIACGGSTHYISGTRVEATPTNEVIIKEVMEAYRRAVENRDAAALVLLASKDYLEHAGTAVGTDDYGYDGLERVLAERLQAAKSIRYEMTYLNVDLRPDRGGEASDGDRAFVDVVIDASFTVPDARGEDVRHDKRDQHQFVLVLEGSDWKFKRGM